MKVADLGFNELMLNKFDNDLFFKDNREFLLEDFKRLSSSFLDIDLPDDVTDQQMSSVRVQVTDLFTFFIVGHLNSLDSASSVFKNKKEEKRIWVPS